MFVEENPNERIRATARRHVLEGSDLDTAARVAREAIQNSVDATLPGQKTDVVASNLTLSPDHAAAFRKLLGLDADDSPIARLSQLGLASPNALTRLAAGEPVDVTIVEDRNTCGLGYDAHDRKDRFEELCLSLGQDRTNVSMGRGGSYGLGKAVYEEASDCNMFVVYSIFEPSDDTGGHHARLFACATFDGHTWEGRKCTGRALFGVHEARESGQPECKPIVDDVAHEIAGRIGLGRDRDEHGTSIMIVGSSIKLPQFRDAVERWWWPRLLSNKLTVDTWADHKRVSARDPRSVAELDDHVRCYTMIEHGIPTEGPLERRLRLRRLGGLRPGTLALKGLESDQSIPTDDSDDSLDNAIALIRSGPLMVVEYLKISGGGDKKCVGVFVGHDDADEALHLSEPPSHDKWNPNSQRLRDAYPDDAEKRDQYQALVRRIVYRVKKHGKKFLKDLNPAPEPPATGGTRRLEQILARVMATTALGPRPSPSPPAAADPFKLGIQEGRETSGPESVATVRLEIELRDDATAEAVDALVAVMPSVVLDDNMRRDGSGRLALASMLVDGEDVDLAGNRDGARVLVHKNRKTVIEARSEPFSREYFARLDIEVTAHPDSPPTDGPSPEHEGAVA